MAKYVLALDQGTTSSRAIVFNHDGLIVTSAQKEFPQIYPSPGLNVRTSGGDGHILAVWWRYRDGRVVRAPGVGSTKPV